MSRAGGLALGAAGLVLVPVVVFMGIGATPTTTQPSAAALADIPGELLPVYQQAAATCNIRWELLAAIGKLESDQGRSAASGVQSESNHRGAMGPMQFLAPTWERYKVDGDHDGVTDPYSPTDAIWSAANNLCANGAGQATAEAERAAVYNYNHDPAYVERVLETAASYRVVGTATASVADLLDNPNLILTPTARKDLQDGVVDQRVIDFLAWATKRHRIAVSILRTGHSQYIRGTDRISTHFIGRGADIASVDGEPLGPASAGGRAFAQEIAALTDGRPDETVGPRADAAALPGFLTNLDHQGHIHVGWQG